MSHYEVAYRQAPSVFSGEWIARVIPRPPALSAASSCTAILIGLLRPHGGAYQWAPPCFLSSTRVTGVAPQPPQRITCHRLLRRHTDRYLSRACGAFRQAPSAILVTGWMTGLYTNRQHPVLMPGCASRRSTVLLFRFLGQSPARSLKGFDAFYLGGVHHPHSAEVLALDRSLSKQPPHVVRMIP
jgi:hypothetical protein